VIEDEASARESIQTVIEAFGCQVMAVSNGREGVAFMLNTGTKFNG
jgi:CheY-like chemotaxis protein